MKEFYKYEQWQAEVVRQHLEIYKVEGKGEDPYTHYYAVKDNYRVGCFGDDNGSDCGSYGVICKSSTELYNWGGDYLVLQPFLKEHTNGRTLLHT